MKKGDLVRITAFTYEAVTEIDAHIVWAKHRMGAGVTGRITSMKCRLCLGPWGHIEAFEGGEPLWRVKIDGGGKFLAMEDDMEVI